MEIPGPDHVRDWRTETAPSADGTWLVANVPSERLRFALIPPGLAVFAVAGDRRSAWRLALWEGRRETDLRGSVPTRISMMDLEQALMMVRTTLRSWVRAEHQQALRHARAAGERAQRAGNGDATRLIQIVVDDLERQEAEADALHTA